MRAEEHRCPFPPNDLSEGVRWICPQCGQRWRLEKFRPPGIAAPATWDGPRAPIPGTWLPDFE